MLTYALPTLKTYTTGQEEADSPHGACWVSPGFTDEMVECHCSDSTNSFTGRVFKDLMKREIAILI